jgi:hypothetical protein
MRGMGMFKWKEMRGQRSEVRDRLIRAEITAAIVANGIAALTTGLTIYVSKLPAVTPVSLSLVFRSWAQIAEFNVEVWVCTFFIFSVAELVRFSRWYCVDRMSGHPRPLTSDL